jgi:hypothetical protein
MVLASTLISRYIGGRVKFIIRSRRGGKTHELLERLRTNPGAVLIAFNEHYTETLRNENPKLRERIMSVGMWMGYGCHGHRYKELLVDNIDLILPALLKARDERIVVSGTDEDQEFLWKS